MSDTTEGFRELHSAQKLEAEGLLCSAASAYHAASQHFTRARHSEGYAQAMAGLMRSSRPRAPKGAV